MSFSHGERAIIMWKVLKNWVRAQQHIQNDLDEYLDGLNAIAQTMSSALAAYLGQDMAEFSRSLVQINETEHRLDTLRRGIEAAIYGRRLLPDTRGDILGLLEGLDKIPNRIQSTIREINLQKPLIPESLHPNMKELVDRGVQIIQVLVQTAHEFLQRPHEVKRGVQELSELEHEADMIEHQSMALLFENSNLDLAHKMQLWRLFERLGSICDMAEDIGDRLIISSLKRLL